MRILIVNKFLHHVGGSETYIFKIGDWLEKKGHEVQYFGMEHDGRCVGNRVNSYTSNMDFYQGSKWRKLAYPLKTIYSKEARVKIRKVLDDFKPDICHINNFNYQLTPSIILEIKKWNKKCRIVFTAHDYNVVCPNHMCMNPNTHKNCEKCLGGDYINCIKGRCIHGSISKSIVGACEGYYWAKRKTYRLIDNVICCSNFLKEKIDTNPNLNGKTIALHNFIDDVKWKDVEKKDYVIYFGRLSIEKGVGTLIEAAKEIPEVNFVIAGVGLPELAPQNIPNIRCVGFQTGENLERLIREARFSIYPSEWYENCPFSVMESQMYGTPVLGANIGGIPELIQIGKTGDLFESGNKENLMIKIREMWWKSEEYSKNCKKINFDTIDKYCSKLIKIYKEGDYK